MGENLKEKGHQIGGTNGLFSGTCIFYHALKKKYFFLFLKNKNESPISDKELFSSYMQILLDSAKPSPRGENFKVRLDVKEKPEESLRLARQPKLLNEMRQSAA